MKYSVSAIVLGFFAALNVAAPAPAAEPQFSPGDVTIEKVSYAGSGCRAGTASVTISLDKTTVTILFDEYEATIGPGAKFSDQVKNCNINFLVEYPPGFQYTLYKNDYTGYALLEPGVTAKQTSSYWFAGFVGNKPTFQSTWKGPYNSDYTFTDTLASLVYSPCGTETTLNLNTQLVLTSPNPKAQGLINTQSIDTKTINPFKHVYGVRWQKC